MASKGVSLEWDRYHESHHAFTGRAGSGALAAIEFDANVGRHLPAPPARILEIGFGEGHTLLRLSKLGYAHLEGWDIARDCVEQARADGVPGTLRHVDASEALASDEGSRFDAVVAKDLLEHLPREALLPFLMGVHHALAPGGVFIARLPNMGSFLAVLLRYDDFTHHLGFTENSLRQVLTLAGFERSNIDILNDILPGWALLRRGLLRHFINEVCLGPVVRSFMRFAIASQRKGPPKVDTLRAIVVARKGPRKALPG